MNPALRVVVLVILIINQYLLAVETNRLVKDGTASDDERAFTLGIFCMVSVVVVCVAWFR